MEADVGNADTGPSEETSDRSHVCEPVEDLVRSGRDAHVREQCKRGRDGQSQVWQSVLGGPSENARCGAGQSEGVESTRRGVHVRGGGGGGGSDERGVDHARETLDTGGLDADDEGLQVAKRGRDQDLAVPFGLMPKSLGLLTDLAAVLVSRLRSGWLYGTKTEMARVPRT